MENVAGLTRKHICWKNRRVVFRVIEESRETDSELNMKREKLGSPVHNQFTALSFIDDDFAASTTKYQMPPIWYYRDSTPGYKDQ